MAATNPTRNAAKEQPSTTATLTEPFPSKLLATPREAISNKKKPFEKHKKKILSHKKGCSKYRAIKKFYKIFGARKKLSGMKIDQKFKNHTQFTKNAAKIFVL